MVRMRLLPAVLAALALAGGCIARHAVGEGELARYWSLSDDVWPQAEAKVLAIGPRRLPSRWTLRQEPSLLWATVSIVRGVERLEEGPAQIEFAVSQQHADMIVSLLGDARQAIEDLRSIADPQSPPTRERWAAAIAGALVSVERVARREAAREGEGAGAAGEDPLAWTAGPVLEMALGYLEEHGAGGLFGLADAGGARDFRRMLAQVVLRVGFALAGKREPPELVGPVVQTMRESPRPEVLEEALHGLLLERFDEAPAAPPGSPLPRLLDTAFSWAPRALDVLVMVLGQWHKMESLGVEFREASGRSVVALEPRVKPAQELRIGDLFLFQPAIVFHGASRIVVEHEMPGTGETAVLFESLDGGGVEVRFEGLGYALVRLLALPLADAVLREVRVARGGSEPGTKMTSVVLLMEAAGDAEDPRRIMAYQDVRRTRRVRREAEVALLTARKEQTFSYVVPGGRYTYSRVKTVAAEE